MTIMNDMNDENVHIQAPPETFQSAQAQAVTKLEPAPAPKPKPLILVVHASVGSGHRSAAHAIAQAIELLRDTPLSSFFSPLGVIPSMIWSKQHKVVKIENKGRNEMRIVVASKGLNVSPCFERCTDYTFYTITYGIITGCQNVPSPGLSASRTAYLMNDLGVDTVISGKIEDVTKRALQKSNIEIFTGASGTARSAVEAYLAQTFTGFEDDPYELNGSESDCDTEAYELHA